MKNNTIQSPTPDRQSTAKKVFVEALCVAVVGAAVAFAANQISPRGLTLTRNYFPAKNNPTAIVTLTPEQRLAERTKRNGLQLVDGSRAVNLFRDPRFKQNTVVFIDARDESHYQEGHIPGAYEFDPYHPDKYFTVILPICRAAEEIVVYCNGSDCDDSETAAILLRDVGIANRKLFVYGGGITEWTTNGLPIEIGARNSGNLRGTNK